MTAAIVIGSIVAYAFIGMVVGSLLERSEKYDDFCVFAGMFWPFVLPAWGVIRVVTSMFKLAESTAARINGIATKPKLPTARARQKETK